MAAYSLDEEILYYLAFNWVNGIGPVRFRLLSSFFGSAKQAWEAPEKSLKETGLPKDAVANLVKVRKIFDVYAYQKRIAAAQIKIIIDQDILYPKLLSQITDPPALLYVRGNSDLLNAQSIGVVGTRKISSYGREVTEKLTSGLVDAGLTIVSGLAYGVDTQAHKTTLECKGKTIAVLGCGVDCIYPKGNEALAKVILEMGGAIISEAPLSRWVAKGIFPARNRIISGLSKGVLVTEAAEDSGSLITARLALEQGREVFAVPGPITSSLSKGPANLIKMGAKLVYSVEDILEEFGLERDFKLNPTIDGLHLSKEEKIVLNLIESEAKNADILIRESGLPAAVVGSVLTEMELKGWITSNQGVFRASVLIST